MNNLLILKRILIFIKSKSPIIFAKLKKLIMKKIILSFIAVCLVSISFSQSTSLKKRPTLGVNFFLKDFATPDKLGSNSLGTVIRDGAWSKPKNMTPGFGIQYLNGINDNVDFMANLGGSFLKYPFLYKSGVATSTTDKFLLETDANLNLKLLTDNYFAVPYLSVGAGISMYGGTYFAAYLPVGTGMQFNLGDETFVNLQFSYHLKVTDFSNYNFHYSLGISSPIFDKKEVVVVAPPPPPVVVVAPPKDTDGDGIPDNLDKCPTVPGVARYQGCPIPDTDGDGINDENDKCPTVKGVARYQGCPIPDTDKDGINDEEDKCPTVPGLARYQGCPIPDTDGDGVNDEEDKCPTEKGPASNHGCPELKDFNFKAENVQFLTGSAELTKIAKLELDKGATILTQHPSLNVAVEGYTDNAGKPDKNKILSQKRADAVKAYLVKKGINDTRISATGFGDANPIGDNKTAKGRTANRRVDFKIKQ